MASGRYFLADVVLTGVLVLSDQQCRRLFDAFDQIAANPRRGLISIGNDWDGRRVYLTHLLDFEIGYLISEDDFTVTFTFFRPMGES
jgi:hypothetical protein